MGLVLGLTGPNASGKGEVATYLGTLGFTLHSLSDIIREEAEAQGYRPEREHLIRIGNELRRDHGPGVLAERILTRLGDRDVVDSIRSPSEVEVLRTVPGFVLIGIDAPAELRFRRSVHRARPGDPATLEAFRTREAEENRAEAHRQQLDATFALADRVVVNGATRDALRTAIDRVLGSLEGSSRTPAGSGPR